MGMLKLAGAVARVVAEPRCISSPLYISRCMASGRNIYVKGGSNKQDIPSETKKLIENARDPDDYSWQLGPGICEPKEVDLTTTERKRATQYKIKYKGNKSSTGNEKVVYYPHAGEQIPDENPSPVLMVEKMQASKGQPYFIKDYLIQIGLGHMEPIGKKVFLPNTPSVGMLLYRMKHIVKITPLKFPNGIPENFDPNIHGFHLSPDGKFTITEHQTGESVESLSARADWMKIENHQILVHHKRQYNRSWSSPLGNYNYAQDTRWQDPGKAASTYEKNKPKNRKWT